MHLNKTFSRLVQCLSAMAMALMMSPTLANDSYPNKPIRFIIPFAAGGAVDGAARMIGQHISDNLGQAVVVENKPGAGGIIAIKQVLNAPADGYTFLVCAAGEIVINPVINKQVDYDTSKDLTPVSMMTTAPNILVVNRDLPVNNISELIEYGRAHPGELTLASSGVGTIQHVTGEVFNKIAGLDVTHVPFNNAPQAALAVAAGRVTMTYASPGTVRGLVERGDLKMLGMALQERYSLLPDVPAIREDANMKSFDVESWFGMFAASGTPEPIITKINALVQEAMQKPEIAKVLLETAGIPMQTTPQQAQDFISREIEKYKVLLTEANIQLN
jgi:tripartite-type tricarboxylate transporter receptor subunit TctC